MEEYEKIVAEAQELAAENQRKIDILLADMTRQELRNTSTDAAALARMERDLIGLVNGSRIKRARDRGILRTAAVMLHKVRRQLLDDADRAARGGLLCVVCAVLPRAMQGEEKASLSRRAGIEGEVMYLRPRVRAEESEVIEGAQKLAELRRRVVLSPSNLALFCGF